MSLPLSFTIGVCALDKKSRSVPMRNILDRLIGNSPNSFFETIIFGDKVILEEPIERWPICDFLIGFYSTGFPLAKAISYIRLRKPFCVNDLQMQWLLLDRRLVLLALDFIDILTPKRLIIGRDFGIDFLERLHRPSYCAHLSDSDTLHVGMEELKKPFVEKPVSGDDHNIYIYYSGGGVRRLFRKVANKSSEYDPAGSEIRLNGSYIYEEFLTADKFEDIKVYTVGPYFAYAETRKSPTVDGVVRRNASGKELREETTLTSTEQEIARRICMAFGQTICGFDMVRVDGRSYVIDVNGWSFVKGSSYYYDTCASILTHTFMKAAAALPLKYPSIHERSLSNRPSSPISRSWRLKTYISCIRHADRTPKQKLKFTLPGNDLFKTFEKARSELYTYQQIILREPSDLKRLHVFISEMIVSITSQGSHAQLEPLLSQLRPLQSLIEVRSGHADTKVQIRLLSDSLSLLVVKWGGEFTHAGWHQAQEFGESLRADLKILNKSLLADIRIFSSEERRVKATATITAKALLHLAKLPSGLITNSPDLLDDNLEAKDEMESVKASISQYLNEAFQNDLETTNSYAGDLARDPLSFISRLTALLSIHYVKFLDTSVTDFTGHKWCCLDSSILWKERWLKIFKDVLPLNSPSLQNVLPLQKEPGRICELYDSLKYDEIHNRAFLDYFFLGASPSSGLKDSLHELFIRTKTLYNWVSISEYGILPSEKLSIGKKIIRKLLLRLVEDLRESTSHSTAPSCRLYFTKESHMYPLLNVIQYGGLSAWTSKPYNQWELDYLSQITFEIYERYPSDEIYGIQAEHSVRISLSQGGYNPSIIDVNLDEKHCLSVVPREWITEYFPLDKAIEALQ